ncbi:nitrilase-related carbon-nitrogen hydrolase [Jatrophihabitans endophyticus]|uniref:nitrilase-related carbon-nitrogen hydrolase n=1 Tax=Jatrophihabitans endophyticus TaxID=1206085 RepID=UPI0019F2FB49|nr:nitrilase-related carbon-nitrogen hydrolase [Jatrophihabitans endophyticus]MBE7187274.1 carbon-nitrogen family hydrolase [Jatrophihabitans endophyticus]
MKVGLVQHDIAWEDAAATRTRVEPMIAAAAAGGAELVVLTEMFATGFSMAPERIAEPEGGPTETFLLEQAARHHVTLVASIAQRGPDGGHRNAGVVARPDGGVERYAKIHPFGYAGENEVYVAGRDFLTTRIGDLRVTVFVCYDLRFADEFWATGPDTDLFVVPANWPAARQGHWDALLVARAIENQAYIAGVNRVGDAPGGVGGAGGAGGAGASGPLVHAGGTVLVDPLGTVLARAAAVETVLVVDVDPRHVARIRTDFPFLADRR